MGNKEQRIHGIIRNNFRFSGRPKHDNLPLLATAEPRGKGRARLAGLLNQLGCKVGAEIGVRAGRSAKTWLQANPELHLYCIDPWDSNKAEVNGHLEQAKKQLAGWDVTFLKTTSMEALTAFENRSLDFVHIDGNHTFDYCAPDIIFWARKVKKLGLIIVHDYIRFYKAGVIDAVDAYTKCHHIDPWYVTRDRLPTAFWVNK